MRLYPNQLCLYKNEPKVIKGFHPKEGARVGAEKVLSNFPSYEHFSPTPCFSPDLGEGSRTLRYRVLWYSKLATPHFCPLSYCVQIRGEWNPVSDYMELGVYSMNKTY